MGVISQLPSFAKAFGKLTADEQALVRAAIVQIPTSFGMPHQHRGIGIRSFGSYFECRAGLGLRVLFLRDDEDFILVTVGNHDHIRKYVRNNR